MTLQFAPDLSEFPNGKFYFIFYQCGGWGGEGVGGWNGFF